MDEYFAVSTAQTILRQPLALTNNLDAFDITIKVHGGGISGQAGAVRHGITNTGGLITGNTNEIGDWLRRTVLFS